MPSSASTPTDRSPREQAGREAAAGNCREPAHREAAVRVVAEVADRLADPERVARIAGVPDNLMHYPGDPQPVWDPLQLSDGHPGVALLYAELAVTGSAPAPAPTWSGPAPGIPPERGAATTSSPEQPGSAAICWPATWRPRGRRRGRRPGPR
ncbi:hypothetical protein [Streptomyces globisporus]|uniref:hypothetical protein n=1 Tax=Streptomyces globisporus TaxID=1908 RepID=UPI001F0BE0BA|nr:hypothetical protein [Streptomyces globisporus]